MIAKPSNGFLSVLGSFTIHFALLLTMLSTVNVPRDEFGQMKEDPLRMYTLVCLMHLVVALVLVLNHFSGLSLGISKDMVNTITAIFYVVVLLQFSINFVFAKAKEKDEIKLKFWLYIELLIFFTNVASSIVFMLYRSCSKNRIYGSSGKTNDTGIEKHQILVSLSSTFFTPFVVTICLMIVPQRWQ